MKMGQLGIELGSRHLRICTANKEEFLKIKNIIAFVEDDTVKANGTRSDLRLYEYEIFIRNCIESVF